VFGELNTYYVMDQSCFSAVIEGLYFLLFLMNGGDDGDDKLVVLTICLRSYVCFPLSCNSGDKTIFHFHTWYYSPSIFTQNPDIKQGLPLTQGFSSWWW
jgi:hypothetical protein